MSHTAPATLLRAGLWMIGSITSFTAMAVAARQISFDLDTFEIMLYRSLTGLLIMLVFISFSGKWPQISLRHSRLHLLRNTCHFAGQNLWFYAIPLIPLAQVFALEFTTPLWVLLMAPLFLGERLTPVRAFAALLGFAGILIVARPGHEALNSGTIAAASAAIGFAGTAIFTKKLTTRTTLANILLWMTALQSLFGLIFAGVDGQIALPSADNLPWLLVIGLGGMTAHVCLTKALSIAPATLIMPIDFARLPLIAFIGFMFYQEPVDGWIILGAVVIFAANYLNIWSGTRRKA
jgi:drug/metabolite transporter (DMT)-like permease